MKFLKRIGQYLGNIFIISLFGPFIIAPAFFILNAIFSFVNIDFESAIPYIVFGFFVLLSFVYFWNSEDKDEELVRVRNDLCEKESTISVMENTHKNTISHLEGDISRLNNENAILLIEKERHAENLRTLLQSNLSSIPWLAGMISDFITFDLEMEAKKLDWGHNIQRAKKVASIRLIRAEAERRIAEAKEAVYQLEYLRKLFPGIDDVLATEYDELHFDGKIPDHDPVMDYVSREEWQQLTEIEKSQLALDRYIASRKKSNWQIGRDYELSVAYEYRQKGYRVDTYGSYMGLEDLGRDLIAKDGATTLIIQCKYWAQFKLIHEKHIYQLYGTAVGYCIENNISSEHVKPVFVTNIALSVMAKKVANYLGISVVERHEMIEFPRIKCNIGKDEYGDETRIFHLPMDDQYDRTKIENAGEFYAFTVREAVNAGFRRAFKWHGNS